MSVKTRGEKSLRFGRSQGAPFPLRGWSSAWTEASGGEAGRLHVGPTGRHIGRNGGGFQSIVFPAGLRKIHDAPVAALGSACAPGERRCPRRLKRAAARSR